MLKVNEKEFIKSYKQYKKDIRLIKILLKDKWYRTKWCKKHSIETLTDEELEKDLKRHQEEKNDIRKIYWKIKKGVKIEN